MTWVIGTASLIFGSMIGDLRVSMREGDQWVPLPIGLRKIHVFSERTVCGFAGELPRAWAALGSINAYMRTHGKDGPTYLRANRKRGTQLLDQAKGWVNELYAKGDPLSKADKYPTELLLLRTFLDPVVNMVLTSGVRVSLASSASPKPRVRSFFLVDQIGSGSELPTYRAAVEETRRSLSGFANFEQAIPGRGVVGQIFARGLSRVISESPEVTVSPELDVCVLSATGAWSAGLRRSDPPLHVCQTFEEFEAAWGTIRNGGSLIG